MKLVGKTQATLDEETRIADLKAEEASLIQSLVDSRYHLDIAQETGLEVWPEILAERAKARERISEIRSELKST